MQGRGGLLSTLAGISIQRKILQEPDSGGVMAHCGIEPLSPLVFRRVCWKLTSLGLEDPEPNTGSTDEASVLHFTFSSNIKL